MIKRLLKVLGNEIETGKAGMVWNNFAKIFLG